MKRSAGSDGNSGGGKKAKSSDGVTVHDNKESFFAAIRLGDVITVVALLEKDPTLVEQEHKGFTPLMHAVTFKQNCIVAILLARGANPGKSVGIGVGDSEKITPLYRALSLLDRKDKKTQLIVSTLVVHLGGLASMVPGNEASELMVHSQNSALTLKTNAEDFFKTIIEGGKYESTSTQPKSRTPGSSSN